MARMTTFRFALDPTAEQREVLARHAGARRFAWNQCLAFVKAALDARDAADADEPVEVPWSPFSLINAFNAWKRSPAAGVAEDGTAGLVWRHEVCQQVFEEAAVDLGRALAAFTAGDSRFPRFRRKGRTRPTFRMRNNNGGVRVGEGGVVRSVRLPKIGVVRVAEDTRRLRRLLRDRSDRTPARILAATVTRGASRWYVAVTVEAPDLHPDARHPPRDDGDCGGWVGVDRGLAAFAVAADADGSERGRATSPKPLAASLRRLRRANRAHARTRPGSKGRARARRRLARAHEQVRNRRRHFAHVVSSRLVKTHDRLVLEDLGVAGMVRNRRLARAIADAGWSQFANMVEYKADWYGARLDVAPRWFPSTRRCSACGEVGDQVPLSRRTFACGGCGHTADRDVNAAANLAQRPWHHQDDQDQVAVKRTETPNARGGEGTGRRTHPGVRDGGTGPCEAGTATPAA